MRVNICFNEATDSPALTAAVNSVHDVMKATDYFGIRDFIANPRLSDEHYIKVSSTQKIMQFYYSGLEN